LGKIDNSHGERRTIHYYILLPRFIKQNYKAWGISEPVKITILDGYIDEPSCLGVPPYISPYPRYVAGAILSAGHDFEYLTVDQVRNGRTLTGNALVVIAGPVVPGRYLRGMPISSKEIVNFSEDFEGTRILGGPLARFGMYEGTAERTFDHIAKKDLDSFVYDFLSGGKLAHRNRDMDEWREWSISGSDVVKNHPDFPQPLIVELDSSRGCFRYLSGGCSFCIEPLYGKPQFREMDDLIDEVHALYSAGIRNFRLGGQSCVFSYLAQGVGDTETPIPNPDAIEKLLKGIRKAAPDIQVLHTDNADPAVIATHPKESRRVALHLVRYCTGANVLALGVESVDPDVIASNNLNADAEQAVAAVRLINGVGSARSPTGLPHLLPGINFLTGLKGERKETFSRNLTFLRELLDSGMMVRRINIRQVLPVRGEFDVRKHYPEFRRFKSRVREEIDRPMIERILPGETVLNGVYLELWKGRRTFGRQVGTYPILVGLPYKTELNRFVNVSILSHGYRSVTGIEFPLNPNTATLDALASLPGIGKKRAARIVRSRPFGNSSQFTEAMDDRTVAEGAIRFLKFDSE
jgi:radical SAM superfamily enzyme with C-terminal helix-hairpin-helix motif